MKRSVLVTGHFGFVGSHFVRRLVDDGWKVTGIDVAAPAGDDCRDLFAWGDLSYDLVVHCAAVVGGRAKIEGAPMAVADNLSIDAGLWQWALRTRPGRVVYFSSSAAYPVWRQTGEFDDAPKVQLLTEDWIDLADIDQPDQTYGLAKLVGEIQAGLVRAEGVPVTVVRPFSGYGPGQPLDYPFPSFIQRAAEKADPFVVWGTGEQVRDWVHIDDIVETVMVMVDEGIDGPVNLCTGIPTSMFQLAVKCAQARGYLPEIQPLPDRPAGVAYRVGDPTLLHQIRKPRVPLEEGIRRALAAHGQ